MSVGIKPSTNKFAFLHVQDSSDESDVVEEASNVASCANSLVAKKIGAANTGNSAAAKKKPRRRKKKNSSSAPDNSNVSDSQLQDWVQHDKELVDSLYDEDLKRAIEMSKVEFEKERTVRHHYAQSTSIEIPAQNMPGRTTERANENDGVSKSASPPKKERRNKTSKTISLEEFQQHVENSLPLHDGASASPERKTRLKASKDIPDFFDEVDKAASYVKRNERAIQGRRDHGKKADLKTGKTNNKRDQKQQADQEKEKIIEKLHEEVRKWEQQFNHVKKRNKQLLVMLQQGEMKDKSELLLEIERLSILRDELTQEVSSLNESLEQERSRSRKLKDEVSKIQAKKAQDVA